MAAFNNDGSFKDVDMTEARSEETGQHSLRNTDISNANSYKLTACSTEKGIKFICKECGKQMTKQNNLNAHIRAIHQGIKYPCGQCQHQATSKGNLERHERAVHEGKKYPCVQCKYQATRKESLAQHKR